MLWIKLKKDDRVKGKTKFVVILVLICIPAIIHVSHWDIILGHSSKLIKSFHSSCEAGEDQALTSLVFSWCRTNIEVKIEKLQSPQYFAFGWISGMQARNCYLVSYQQKWIFSNWSITSMECRLVFWNQNHYLLQFEIPFVIVLLILVVWKFSLAFYFVMKSPLFPYSQKTQSRSPLILP